MSRFLTGIMNTENKVLGVIVGFIVYNSISKFGRYFSRNTKMSVSNISLSPRLLQTI